MMEITVFQSLKILTILKIITWFYVSHNERVSKKFFNKLNNLKTQTKDNEKRKQEVLTNVGGIYNQLHYIYKNKYNKKINCLDAENK